MTMPLQPTGGRILVLDDDPGVRQTLSTDLFSLGFEVICCADVPTLLYQVRKGAPRCILLDQETSGIEALNQLRSEGYTAPVLMISGRADIATAVRALKQGANDFLQKPFRGPDLIARIKAAINEAERKAGAQDRRTDEFHFPGRAPLTCRERDVLAEMTNGFSTKEIACQLGLSPRTVEGHRVSIMRKLGAKNLVQLLRFVFSPSDLPASE
jgi:FixJ family two-component response regulator